MKLEGLRILHTQLLREMGPESIGVHVYYYFKERWHDLATEAVCTDDVARDLNKSRAEAIAYHATSSPDAWFYLPHSDAAVRLAFTQSPQLSTRRRNRERISKIQESASNAYKVSHNPLTQLLARDAFRERLNAALSRAQAPQIPSNEAQEGGLPRSLAVLALDIDHFKQVNDTWGHLYGDQVLRVFARRLEDCASKIRARGTGRSKIELGHPSGEEFLVLIEANATRDQFFEWANEFRKAISDEVMPTDIEWQWLSETGAAVALTPPPLPDRATSASIGLALHNAATRPSSGGDIVSDILDRADTALYRAKAAGRNQVISFDDILTNCGRVLEHDTHTRVVALDIGSNVGVTLGQEFKVFLPTFSGSTKFLLNDGRTKRTLGTYPRVESARVVVFNVQPEISFAFIANPTETPPPLVAGSLLEAIPAGSIGHLLPSSSRYFQTSSPSPDRDGLTELQTFVRTAAEKGSPFAVVVRFSRDGEYLRKYGSVALNMALSQLYREAQLTFHAAKSVEVLDRSSICVAGLNAAYKESLVTTFVDSIAAELPELGVYAGVFCEQDRKPSESDDLEALDASNAIEFARFAASDAGRLADARVRHFSHSVAYAALQALRDSRSLEVAYADFQRLRKLGVESARLLNLGGLIAGGLGHVQEAVELYAAAMAKDPKELIYKSNYGTAAYRVGEIEPALKVLNALPNKDVEKLSGLHPYGYLGYARLLARAKLNGSPLFDAARFAVLSAAVLTLPQYAESPELTVIREALQKQ